MLTKKFGLKKSSFNYLARLLLCVLLITGLFFTTIPTPMFADLNLVNIASDSFTAANGTYLLNYTDGTGFTGKWKDDAALTTDLPSNEFYIMNNQMTTVNPIKWGGASGQVIDLYRGLNEALDFNTDRDYYIQFVMYPRNMGGDTFQYLRFGGKFDVGYKRNDSLGQVFPSTSFSGSNVLASNSLTSGAKYTFVVHINAKASGSDTLKLKVFSESETPTYTPSSWDLTVTSNRTDSASYLGLIYKNGGGSNSYPIFDEISVNKSTETVVIASDPFTAADGTFLVNYTGGTGFSGKWKDDSALTTDLPATEFYINGNQMTTVNSIKWGGASGQSIDMFRGLNQAIDFHADKDYYIQFTMHARNFGGDTFQYLNFGGKFNVGYKRVDTAVYPYSNFNGSNTTGANSLTNGTKYTFYVYINARKSALDTLYLKAFADTETPTFNPSSWDITTSFNRTDSATYLGMLFKNGSGSGTYPTFDNLLVEAVNRTYTLPSYSYKRGVNIAGAEFNASAIPGTLNVNYTFNNQATFTYFANKGFDIMRVPILWERIQPTLNGPLDTAYLNNLKTNIAWAKAAGAQVIIDIHNYGRYNGNVIGVSSSVPISSFTDLWVRLSNEFKNESGVYAYDLMNEPHGMGTGANDWKVISQAAVTAIRNNGDNKLIMVEGTYYANAHGWATKNGTTTSWITDPANNFMYSAHCYFDSNASGTYTKSYDEELAANPNLAMVGVNRVMDFITWCNSNNVRGFIGEFGIPNNDSRWHTVLENFLDVLDENGMDATYWAGGTWWGSYPLSIQPTNNYTTDAAPMSVLLNHLSN